MIFANASILQSFKHYRYEARGTKNMSCLHDDHAYFLKLRNSGVQPTTALRSVLSPLTRLDNLFGAKRVKEYPKFSVIKHDTMNHLQNPYIHSARGVSSEAGTNRSITTYFLSLLLSVSFLILLDVPLFPPFLMHLCRLQWLPGLPCR